MNDYIIREIYENGNILVEEDNTIYEIDGECLSKKNGNKINSNKMNGYKMNGNK